MLKWHKKQTTHDTTLLDNHRIKQVFLQKLQPLVGVTQSDFQSLYSALIDTIELFLRKPNEESNTRELIEQCDNTLAALKKRRGYSLPLGEDTEVMFRQREQWTYAVFTASILQTLRTTATLDIAKALIPTDGFDWLHRNTCLFSLWQDFLDHQPQGNIFTTIIQPSLQSKNNKDNTKTIEAIKMDKKSSGSPIENTMSADDKDVSSNKNEEADIECNTDNHTISDSEKIRAALPDDTVIVEKTLTQSVKVDEPVTENTLANDISGLNVENETKLPNTLPQYSANYLLRWVKDEVQAARLSINQEDSYLFGTHDGLVINHSKIIDQFLASEAKQHHVPLPTLSLKYKVNLTRMLKKHPWVVRYDKNRRIQSYCLGDVEKRNTFEGMTIKTVPLLDNEIPIPIHPDLTIDPFYDAIDASEPINNIEDDFDTNALRITP